MLRERLEREIERNETLSVLFDALGAERAVVVGNGPTAHVQHVPDIPTRLAAVRSFTIVRMGSLVRRWSIQGLRVDRLCLR